MEQLIFRELVTAEKKRARKEYGDFNSIHEIYGVLAEELDEVFDQVKLKPDTREPEALLKELVQLASTAENAAEDLHLVIPTDGSPENLLYKNQYDELMTAVHDLLDNCVINEYDNRIGSLQKRKADANPAGFKTLLVNNELFQDLADIYKKCHNTSR